MLGSINGLLTCATLTGRIITNSRSTGAYQNRERNPPGSDSVGDSCRRLVDPVATAPGSDTLVLRTSRTGTITNVSLPELSRPPPCGRGSRVEQQLVSFFEQAVPAHLLCWRSFAIGFPLPAPGLLQPIPQDI